MSVDSGDESFDPSLPHTQMDDGKLRHFQPLLSVGKDSVSVCMMISDNSSWCGCSSQNK
jgi:hypothetical protein